MKSYNKAALRGSNYDDAQWQQDMIKAGIYIPDEMLYTPEGPKYVMRLMKEQNIRDNIEKGGMDFDAATKDADETYNAAMKSYDKLMK